MARSESEHRASFTSCAWLLVVMTMFAVLLQTVTGVSMGSSQKVQQQSIDTTTPRILIPLYIYPLPNAWVPLFTAIKNNPSAAFTVAINPNSGPGNSKAPDADYAAAIKQLRATAGINQILELVGYVSTDYGKRAAAEVKADVAKFFDIADHVIVFEDKLSNFNYTEYKQRTASRNNAGTPFQRSYILYNVDPTNATTNDGKKFTLNSLVKASINALNAKGGLFITDLDIQSTDVYASFSSIWKQFVKSVASL
ncbi:hypothetical protein NDA16_003691 [Ustilago loliicola]|nr:hypothetical protein NDA16_003691 [Ustilago loliicola]